MVANVVNLLFVLFLLAGVPVLSYLTTRQDGLLLLPRRALYFSAALSQWLLALLTVLIGVLASAEFAGLQPLSWEDFARWTAGLLGASFVGMGVGFLLEALGWWPEESPLVNRLIPHSRSEKIWALLVVAPTAGFCEEFVYRGYLFSQLGRFSHSLSFAWVISSVAFGLCHTYQKFSGVIRAMLLGALLAMPVALAGSIYPAMAAHFLIDVAGLLWIGPATLKRSRPAE